MELVDAAVPDVPRKVNAVVVIPDEDTDLDVIQSELSGWEVPLFVIGGEQTEATNGWVQISPDRVDSDLLPEIRRHTMPSPTDHVTIWASETMVQIQHTIDRIGPTELPVLVTGESGTGKEVVANALHLSSKRNKRRLVVVDCAAIAPTLMESELFGHQKGAFTGASTTTRGLVREAHDSTFFLDEIGELPTPVQVKLLRLLQDGSYRPVGGTETRVANLRIIAATNRDIEAEVAAGRFRRDLYHRLNGARIHIPPLRERVSDIAPLFTRYLEHYCRKLERTPLQISEQAWHVIRAAYWPGNVRELVNTAHFVASLARGKTIEVADLPPSLRNQEMVPSPGFIPIQEDVTPISSIRTDLAYKDAKRAWLNIFEIHYVQSLLHRNQGNVSAAAEEAGMDRRSIQRIVKRINAEAAASDE